MKRILSTLCAIVFIGVSFFLFARTSEKTLYPAYYTMYDYRKLTPELFPPSEVLKIMAIGHDNSYADVLWVNLVQFIGDNVGNEKYLDFSHLILSNISALNPYFARAYEIDLLFTPLIYADSQDDMTEDERYKINRAIEHGNKGMEILCDKEKIDAISELPYGEVLWSRDDLKNPCKSGMIPYYIGFHYSNDFQDGANASYYYKIAGMNDHVPESTRFLGPIAFANTVNPLDAAVSFLLIAHDGYDKEPYSCKKLTELLLNDIKNKRSLDDKWIDQIRLTEQALENPKDAKLIESYGVNNCYDSLGRGIKQIYIAYITEKAKDHPDITNARDLVATGIIKQIPTISSQKGYTLRKIAGRWAFRNY